MRGTAFSTALASSAGKKKSSGGPDCTDSYIDHLRCLEISPRAFAAELRTPNSLSLSNSTIRGTAFSIALESSAGKKKSSGGPHRADN